MGRKPRRRYPPLTDYQRRLVEENTGLCGEAIRKRFGTDTERLHRLGTYEDAIQVGVEGLIRAARKYDPERPAPRTGLPVKFCTYAFWWVRQALQRWEERGAVVHVPVHSRDEAAAAIGRRWCISLDDSPHGHPGTSLGELLLGRAEREIDTERAEQLHRALKRILPREREVLRLRFFDGLTLTETGERIGVTRERVRQIEGRALIRLHREARRLGMRRRP